MAALPRSEDSPEETSPNTWRISVQYVTDEDGNRTHVIIPNDQFEALLDDLEDVWDLRALEDAKNDPDYGKGRPASEVFADIERKHGWHTTS